MEFTNQTEVYLIDTKPELDMDIKGVESIRNGFMRVLHYLVYNF